MKGSVLAWVAWLSAIGGSVFWINDYAATPGEAPTETLIAWPEGTALGPLGDRGRLILFAHPRCPCTRATIRNLERTLLSPEIGERAPALTFVFWTPETSWRETDIVAIAGEVSGAKVVFDEDGALTRSFGATTSGHATLFGRKGELVFAGGLTATRAHEGPSPGTQALEAWMRGEEPRVRRAPTFGCPILDPL